MSMEATKGTKNLKDNARQADEERMKGKTYSFRDAVEIAQMEIESAVQVWGGLLKDAGALCEIIGEPGLGKSRLILIIAICQVLGIRLIKGWPIYEEPLVWLFFGTENSLRRWNHDLRLIFGRLNNEQKQLLRGHVILPTLEDDGDTFLELSDAENVAKLKNAVASYNPNVTVWDPYGDLLEDELNDGEIKHALRTIKQINRAGNDPSCVGYVLNHARMGIKQIAAARGADMGNFGRNSKKIVGSVRSVVNLRTTNPGGNHGEGIELIHAKHNDTDMLPLAAVKLCSDMWYEEIIGFDHDAYQQELDRLAGNKDKTGSCEKPRLLTQDEINDYLPKLADQLIMRELPLASGKLITQIRAEANTTKTGAEYVIQKLLDYSERNGRGLYVWERKQPKANFITTDAQQCAQEKLDQEAKKARRGEVKNNG